MWVASDWPIHDIAERYNYSVHMVQHLMFIDGRRAAPAARTPAWLAALGAATAAWLLRTVRALSRFVPALLLFNLVLVFTHWPLMVNESLRLGARALRAAHGAVRVVADRVDAGASARCPEIPRLAAGHADALPVPWSVVPTVPASFLTFGSAPLYKFYEGVPHLFGLSTLEDQQLAGLIMKIGAGLLLWVIIAVVFFRWAAEEERANTPRHGLDELDRELTEMGLRR